ncbi:hypothetical protein PR202_gb02944 [Eleusine coracana subsp. coracana]|uniref:Uncharacterized protein n=1 Tax=Eleusine coracana subsp. coracana TaxID=191504 RepID=A0AAV5E0R4_ELECO|nr:hypothetical protein PR202_gb02944 [Eleusine coracana subsp. coracana]
MQALHYFSSSVLSLLLQPPRLRPLHLRSQRNTPCLIALLSTDQRCFAAAVFPSNCSPNRKPNLPLAALLATDTKCKGILTDMDVVTFGVVVGIVALLFVLVLVVTIEGVCKRNSAS